MTGRRIVLAAGGTGGHMFPAHALGEELVRRGHAIALITDERGQGYPGLFDGVPTHVVDSGTATGGGPLRAVVAGLKVLAGARHARRLLAADRPAAVVGFGGYPALPAMLAARSLSIPYCIHEQNAVLGRVNRLMAGRAAAIATSFVTTRRLSGRAGRRAVATGNPVREAVAALHGEPYPTLGEAGLIRLLVIGGSQGARVLSDVVPAALTLLPTAIQRRLQVTQQCRPEDMDRTRRVYDQAGIAAELATFLEDMPERLRWCHLVVARAGASTLAELTAAGRPCVLVPLAIAADDHQTANAEDLAQAGGAWVLPEPTFTPAALAKQLHTLLAAPERLTTAADAARGQGRPGAVHALADLVERIAAGGTARDAARPAGDGAVSGPPSPERRVPA